MKKILLFIVNLVFCVGIADAAVRDGTSVSRSSNTKPTQSRISTSVARTNSAPTRPLTVTSRSAPTKATNNISARTATQKPSGISPRSAPVRKKQTLTNRSATVTARATTDTTPSATSETRTGAEYEACKTAYFTCMDQFCTLKNDSYRRCSCSDRVFDLIDARNTLQDANEQLTTFNENLDVVGMTAAQATAMRNASEGENALTSDKSASKALLQAIMNSIRGEDTNVSGKFADLNSINISFDTSNAFGMTNSGQVIATYNGQALYQAVYPQCRQAVQDVCNNASLQRAITAYLMTVEQDCNTVQTAIEMSNKQLKAAIREGSAMLDLARVENRKNHNSADITTCINNVESAVLSEEVCGENYHKCLDNGEFIDVSTGAPIAGVKEFYKLEELLTFNSNLDATEQQLSKNNKNRTFVANFEKRVKKFAEPALDKCTENADFVWAEYLDKALLDIYYAQKAKVAEIKQGCFDFVSSCYINSDKAITSAMSVLTGDNNIVVKPDQIALSSQMCADYVDSCNNMFQGNIIADYIATQKTTDTLNACRAVVQQCFTKYGGANYENFYYPYSGLFVAGTAPEWFSLYTLDENGNPKRDTDGNPIITSPCAKQLLSIDACKTPDIYEKAFGGMDKLSVEMDKNGNEVLKPFNPNDMMYGIVSNNKPLNRYLRSTGVATEVYNQIISTLTTQCSNLQGRFVEPQFVPEEYETDGNLCIFKPTTSDYVIVQETYGLQTDFYDTTKIYENMCPRDYDLSVDLQSWGMCSCWENGGRRSQNGVSTKCSAVYYDNTTKKWKDALGTSDTNQVCVYKNNNLCTNNMSYVFETPLLPDGQVSN